MKESHWALLARGTPDGLELKSVAYGPSVGRAAEEVPAASEKPLRLLELKQPVLGTSLHVVHGAMFLHSFFEFLEKTGQLPHTNLPQLEQ